MDTTKLNVKEQFNDAFKRALKSKRVTSRFMNKTRDRRIVASTRDDSALFNSNLISALSLYDVTGEDKKIERSNSDIAASINGVLSAQAANATELAQDGLVEVIVKSDDGSENKVLEGTPERVSKRIANLANDMHSRRIDPTRVEKFKPRSEIEVKDVLDRSSIEKLLTNHKVISSSKPGILDGTKDTYYGNESTFEPLIDIRELDAEELATVNKAVDDRVQLSKSIAAESSTLQAGDKLSSYVAKSIPEVEITQGLDSKTDELYTDRFANPVDEPSTIKRILSNVRNSNVDAVTFQDSSRLRDEEVSLTNVEFTPESQVESEADVASPNAIGADPVNEPSPTVETTTDVSESLNDALNDLMNP